jgi:cytochrome c oxidase assembly protein subunit 20
MDIVDERGDQSLSFWEPLKSVEKIPCARNSLLSGIASGAGIGVIRGISAGQFSLRSLPISLTGFKWLGAFVASNWAVGTFVVVSIGSWYRFFYSFIIVSAKMNR